MPQWLRNSATFVGVLMLSACSSTPAPQVVEGPREAAHDFSGHWEVDFAASDSLNGQIAASLRQRQRDMERRARNAGRNAASLTYSLGGSSYRDIIALADMAEIITEPQLLEVLQTEDEVRVRRENTFALVCDFSKQAPVVTETPYGRESCTWRGRELLFRIDLPEGLTVEHRLLLAEDRNSLALTTAMTSSRVRDPMQVRKVFRRYDPEAGGYRCTETLSRGKVCTTETAESP